MSKGKRKRRHPSHQPAQTPPSVETIVAELDTLVSRISGSDTVQTGPIWGAVHKLLLKSGADHSDIARIIATRDTEELQRLVQRLHGEEPESAANEDQASDSDALPGVSADTKRKALRAFRKRLKLTRLDHESRLGVGPMTSGRHADFDAIIAPHEFEREVWEALVAEGKLRSMGQGFYMLAESDSSH